MYDPLRAKAKVVFYSSVTFLFGLGIASALGWTSTSEAMPVIDQAPQISEAAVQPALDLSEAFINLADAVTPAVVRIEALRPAALNNDEISDAFRRRFGIPEDRELPPSQGRIAGGSGFVVSADGYILTNNHVIEGATEIKVYFPDRSWLDARIIGADPFTDVALIKVDADHDVPAMAFGDSDGVRVGEWVLAIGNPGFGNSASLDFTVTAGIISARGRPLRLLQDDLRADPRFGAEASRWAIEDFIQTDAVINPGNSGGPMVNLRGQVVGINSAIASTNGSYQGYGFAIPINLARHVMEDLVEYGYVKRPRIGVEIITATAEDAEVYGLPSVSGVLVQNVDAAGPAAGSLEPQDVIVALDGTPIGYVAELQARIAQHRPGERVGLTVYRNRRPVEVEIRLDEAPINAIPTTVAERPILAEERLGIIVDTLDEELASELRFSAPGGVVLAQVAIGSPAQRRGVGAYIGRKLVAVNDALIESPDDVRDALAAVAGGEIVSLHFESQDGSVGVVNVRMPG
jgi:serine protease Do